MLLNTKTERISVLSLAVTGMYDLHIHTKLSIGEDTVEEMASMARKLGLGGIGIVTYYPEIVEIPDAKEISDSAGIDIVKAIMIKASSPEDMNKSAQKCRNKAELLLVHGGDYDVNRAACENPLIDVICHPELGRHDSGLDHICAKAAADNNVAVEINFREILELNKKQRVYTLSAMEKNIKLCKKYGAPLITSSAAVNKWGMRGGRELASIAHLLGLDLREAIDSVSTIPEEIVKKNREKLAGKTMEGMKIEGGEE